MTAKDPETLPPATLARAGLRCVHCERTCGNLAGGFARITGLPVCSKPTQPGRPDCYRMVTMKFHPLMSCPECVDSPGKPEGEQ